MSQTKRLLIVANTPSENTQRIVDAVLAGANHPDIAGVEATFIEPLQATPDDVKATDAIIVGSTENLGYLSGTVKDFFDRCYYPCLEETQGLPYALYIRAGHDGTGSTRAAQTIITGLRWREVHEPLLMRGDFQESFIEQAEELGMYMAAGLEAAIF